MASPSVNAGSSGHHPVASSSSGSRKMPAIFLSHSGKEKPFVERLYDALQKVNHVAFFDKHTLRKGERFPESIKAAARECVLGIVVLSDSFLTSPWPLLELDIMVRERGPDAKMLPLFYKLEPKNLKKDSNKYVQWHEIWEQLAKNPQDVKNWEDAVDALRKFNGEIFNEGRTSEAQYIKRVVQSICREVPCPLPYDTSEIRGHCRLAEVVAKQFDDLRQEESVCMVGLHGVGGSGKSTMCKALVNFYLSEYIGKSHHLELPTDSNEKEKIVPECKKLLQALTEVEKTLLERVDDIDMVIQLMKDHLHKHDVFLAIDNVWERSREVVGKILKARFSPRSKILITSRSKEILKELFWDQNNSHVAPLPTPNRAEALQIFQQVVRVGELDSLVREEDLVDGVLNRCSFDGSYHPLALKALGGLVRKQYMVERDLRDLPGIFRQINKLHWPKNVKDVIRLSYDSLEEHKQRMFLDIIIMQMLEFRFGQIAVEEVCRWLSFLYKDQVKGESLSFLYKDQIKGEIWELCLAGLLQLETDTNTDEKIITVHDLYDDLANSELESSSRYFIAGRSRCAVEDIQWQHLETVILDYTHDLEFIETLQRQKCRRLQILVARGVNFSGEINMHLMPALCVLKLHNVSLKKVLHWPTPTLAITDLDDVCVQEPFESTPFTWHQEGKSLIDVSILHCEGFVRMADVHGFICLETLQIHACSLRRIPDLSDLPRLVTLFLGWNSRMEEVVGFSSSLRYLEIQGCSALKSVPDMSKLTRLEILKVTDCESLERIPDLSGLTGLELLCLRSNGLMEKVGGLSPTLRGVFIGKCMALEEIPDMSVLTRLENLEIRNCDALKKIPDVSGLAGLVRLCLEGNGAMEEVEGLNSSLRDVNDECKALEIMADVSKLTRLEDLTISGCRSLRGFLDLSGLAGLVKLCLVDNSRLEKVVGLSSSLRHVCIWACNALERVPDMSGLARLVVLQIYCQSMQGIPNVSGLAGLDTLRLTDSQSLKQLDDESNVHSTFASVPHTSRYRHRMAFPRNLIIIWEKRYRGVDKGVVVLRLERSRSMEKGDDLSASLGSVTIGQCGVLERVPRLSGFTRLERLEIQRCQSLQKDPDLSTLAEPDQFYLLREIGLMEQGERVGGLSASLRELAIEWCDTLEKVPDLSGLTRLEELVISGCKSLKTIPNLGALAKLDRLHLSGNESMEKVIGWSPNLGEVHISDCKALERVPDMSGLTRLSELSLRSIQAMVEVGALSPSLTHVEIWRCNVLKKVPDMSRLTRLSKLMLHENEELEEVEGHRFGTPFVILDIKKCPRLRSLPDTA